MTLRIGINAIALLSPLTGLGHYARSLIAQLQSEADIDPVLFYATHWSRRLYDSPPPGLDMGKRAIYRFVPRPYRFARAVAQTFFTLGTGRGRLDVYHEPNFLAFRFAGPTVVSAHDLSWILYPETHPADRVANMNRLFPRSLERAAHVITDAEFIRRQIIETFGVAADRITAVPLAARAVFHPRPVAACTPVLAPLGLENGRFLLAVGTVEPRKNLALTVRAYGALPAPLRRHFPLVIVGMRGWLNSPIEALLAPLVASGDVRMLGYRDDAALAALYASCRVMVYPSIYEGFGLPPLEAMASGAPVIVSNASTLPEVVGDAGILVDPQDVDALRTAMESIIGDESRAEQLRDAGLARAAAFSWQRCARETIAIYRQVAGAGAGA